VFVWAPGTTDADFGRAQYLASFLGACSLTTTPAASIDSTETFAAPVDAACVATCYIHLRHAVSDVSSCSVLCASAGMELWQLQQAAPRGRDSSDAGSSRLSDGADLASGVELGSFDGSIDIGDNLGVHQGSRRMFDVYTYIHIVDVVQ
jgi:hypothetical protein